MQKYVVVTGAAGGMGRALVQTLLTQYRVIAVDHRETALAELSADTSASFTQTFSQPLLQTCLADISSPGWVDRITPLLQDAALHGIVNLAGVSCGDGLEQLSDEDWAHSLAVNVSAPMQLIRWATPRLKANQGGSIVNVGSPVGIVGARKSSYAASKSALQGLTMSTARELGAHNIRANLLLPGPTITDMTADWPEEKRDAIAAGSFLKRLCTAEEIARVIAFLLDDEQSSYLTAAVVDMTAGSMFGH